MGGLSDADRAIMDMFVRQSLEKSSSKRPTTSSNVAADGSNDEDDDGIDDDDDEVLVRCAFFKIGKKKTKKIGDDSPVATAIDIAKRSAAPGEFDYEGKLIKTDGGKRSTKLTKLFKRRDNEGLLLDY